MTRKNKAQLALARLQEQARRTGAAKISLAEINKAIQATRKARRG